jgi:hypothetical protein
MKHGNIITASLILFAVCAMGERVLADATTQSLIQASDISFVGKFGVNNSGSGCSTFQYGGYGLSFYKDTSDRKTLFLSANAQQGDCAGQIQVPTDGALRSASTPYASLTIATTLQSPVVYTIDSNGQNRFGDAGLDPNNGNPVYTQGFYVHNGRLIVTAQNSYSFDQSVSVGVKSSTTLAAQNFSTLGYQGFSPAVSANPRAASGYTFLVPPEWQGATLFDAPAVTGNAAWSVISTSSGGPALTTFDPDDVGVVNPIPGKTVLHYQTPTTPLACPTDGACQSDVFNLTSRIFGGGFVPNSRTVFFVEGHGIGPYCYGTALECGNDTVMSDVKGPHAQPYRYQILAYDANDLLAVKNGTMQTYAPRPYNQASPWVLHEFDGDDPRGHGAAFDPETGRLYVMGSVGNQPEVLVYQVTIPASGPDLTPPTITSVTSTTPDGSYNTSDAINITVNFSEAVTSTGNVTVTLETGTTDRTCTFIVSNASSGSCTYTVQAGDTSNDLTTNSIVGTITDQAGNAMVNFVPATTLAQNRTLAIDTAAPTNQNTVFPVSQTKGGSTSVAIVSANETGGAVWFAPLGTTTFTEGPTMSQAPGTATSVPAPNTLGTYRLFVIDAAGNVSDPSSAVLTVDSLAAYQTLVIDGGTPVAVKSNATVLATTSFTPPAGSVLYVLVANQSTVTGVTDNRATHLTYTGRGSYGNASNDTRAALYTAPVTTSQAMTVSVTQSVGDYAFVKVLVMTGADTESPVGAVIGGRGAVGAITDTYMSTIDTSLGWLLYADWTQQVIPTPGANQSLLDSYTVAGQDTYALIRRTQATPSTGTSVTLSTTAPTSGAQISHLTFEMRPAVASGDTTPPAAPTDLTVE